MGVFGKDSLQCVGLEEGCRLGDEDDAAAVGEGGRADGLVVHPIVLAEQIIDGILLLEGQRVLQGDMLVGDVLHPHDAGGLLLDALHHLGVPPEGEQAAQGQQEDGAADDADTEGFAHSFICG